MCRRTGGPLSPALMVLMHHRVNASLPFGQMKAKVAGPPMLLIVELAIPFTRLVRAKNMVDSTAFSNLSGGQFTPKSGGQFKPNWGGQFHRIFLNHLEELVL